MGCANFPYPLDATTNSPKTMNDTLLDQCRREAEERYPCAIPGIIDDYERRRWVKLWAECLYAERSKRPPAVDGPPMITVEEAKHVAWDWAINNRMVGKGTEPVSLSRDLEHRLTAAATNNTNDNEAR